MTTKEILIGLIVFSVTTVAIFLMLNILFHLSETLSVVIAIILGIGAETIYRKKAGDR
ncbi:hypothetical protein [Anaerobacillus arseniciselenatis]|uniref:hypothetical protein n=1 Tax=Anaerobacillus arseniciselenatis TaxID=85682 RepID=UPI001470B851|nr:hypothetical protein [Anaerobacillus arseniciselenatis]